MSQGSVQLLLFAVAYGSRKRALTAMRTKRTLLDINARAIDILLSWTENYSV